ncbi:MAG: DUF1579 domain-containing protein [Deltaproteobacteria bacterium]|nr:DUF1579 domain-containing protein [Deltaproteobacteria bacterium]
METAGITQEEMMKSWATAGAPGEQHHRLERFIGTWDSVTRTWMPGSKESDSVSRGTFEYRWLIPGLWQIGEFHGEFMGRPFQGFEVRGYDNLKKKHVGVWLDSTSTAILRMEGNFDPKGETLILFGAGDDPVTGEQAKMMRFTTRMLDDDRFVFEIHDMTAGLEGFRMMEATYTRRRGQGEGGGVH